MWLLRFAGALFLCLLFTSASAQTRGHGQGIYPEKLHTDVDVLLEALHQRHPDPYRYHPRHEIARIAARVKDSIRVPLDGREFAIKLLPLFHAIGDRACGTEIPDPGGRFQQKTPLLPLKVRIIEEGVFVEEELKGFRSVPSGSRIVAINGDGMSGLVDRLSRMVVADGANTTWKLRRVEEELHLLHALHMGTGSSFQVRFITPNGETGEETIHALTGDEIQRSRKPPGVGLHPWAAGLEARDHTMWLTMRSMDGAVVSGSGQRPERFLDALLAEIKEQDVRTLVLDLRGAGGADIELAAQVYSVIAREPFKLLENVITKGPAPDPSRLPMGHLNTTGGLAHTRIPSQATAPTRFNTGRYDPHPKAYQGKVYVVCDGGTREAAALMVMAAKRSGRAKVFGEETGSNSAAFTGGSHVLELPNSGVRVEIPLHRFIPHGVGAGPADRGEEPHHVLTTDMKALADGHDGVRQALMRLIRALR